MQPLRLLLFIISVIILLATTAAPITASIEWRLLTTGTSNAGRASGRLLFQTNSVSEPWKSVCSSGFTAYNGNTICRYLGYGSFVKAEYDTLAASAAYPFGMTNVRCYNYGTTRTPSLSNFYTLCSATTSSSCLSNTAVHLTCGNYASRAGFEVGVYTEVKNSSGSDSVPRYVRVGGHRDGDWSQINGQLELREPHSTTWGSFCFSESATKTEAADAMCKAFSYETGAHHKGYYIATPASDSAVARYGALTCPAAATTGGAASSSSLSSCYYNDLSTVDDCSASTRPTARLGVQCQVINPATDESQTTLIIAVSCSVAGVVLCTGLWIYICKVAGRPADGGGRLAVAVTVPKQQQLPPPQQHQPQHQQQQHQQPPPPNVAVVPENPVFLDPAFSLPPTPPVALMVVPAFDVQSPGAAEMKEMKDAEEEKKKEEEE